MRWMIAAAGALLACTQPAGECGPGGTCPDGQTCHRTYNVCYLADVPAVSWASPQVGETLVGTSAPVSGIIDFGGRYTAEISIGRPDQWQSLSISAAGQFSTTLSLPSSNGAPQPLRVRITEPATSGGRVTVQSIYRAVDNVAPALSFSEAALRPTPLVVRVVASEPMAGSAPLPEAVALDRSAAAAVPGRWNADGTELRFEPLEHDTTYQVQVPAGALTDRAGNATASAFSVTFTTEPAAPAPDAVIAIGSLDLTDLEASSDGEGAVSVVVGSSQGMVVWGEFDTRTGLFRALGQAVGDGLQRFQTLSAPMPDARWEDDGTSKRASGMMMSRGGGQSLIYEDVYSGAARGTFVSVNPGGVSYVPGPAMACRPAEAVTLETDPATGQLLLRHAEGAGTPVSLPALPSWSLFHDASLSEWLTVSGGTVYRSPWHCACGATPQCLSDAAQPLGTGAVSGGRMSVADTPNDDRAIAYDTATGRALLCLRGCGGGTCTNVGSENASAEASVASANEGSSILYAERSGAAVILSKRDLAQGCGAGPTPSQELGRLATGSSIRTFRPVMFGSRPGLLYLSTAGGPGVLRTFIP